MSTLNPLQPMAPWLEEAWIGRYLGRELADEERAWFETYLLDKPHLLDRWATELDLRDGIDLAERQAGAARAAPAGVATPPTPITRGHARPARRRLWRAPALAASVAIAFGTGFLANGLFRAERTDTVIADPTRIVVDVSRGGASAANVDNAASASEYVLIDALVPADASYVAVRGPGLPDRVLSVSNDGVATLLLRRSELGRIGPLTLVIKAGGHEFERPLPLTTALTGRKP